MKIRELAVPIADPCNYFDTCRRCPSWMRPAPSISWWWAFLVYQCLMVVRGTRAGAILLGIAVIVCLYVAAVWADLEALHSVLSLIVPYIGLAVIVLFQSEIRRTLASLGRRRLLGLAGVFHAPEAANEILMAVEQLAAKKTGALIVLERDMACARHRKRGAAGGAGLARSAAEHLSAGLPLHDGAAIIQKDLIAAAACFCRSPSIPACRASWARATAPPSASPRKPTACRWWFPRRPAAFRWRRLAS